MVCSLLSPPDIPFPEYQNKHHPHYHEDCNKPDAWVTPNHMLVTNLEIRRATIKYYLYDGYIEKGVWFRLGYNVT